MVPTSLAWWLSRKYLDKIRRKIFLGLKSKKKEDHAGDIAATRMSLARGRRFMHRHAVFAPTAVSVTRRPLGTLAKLSEDCQRRSVGWRAVARHPRRQSVGWGRLVRFLENAPVWRVPPMFFCDRLRLRSACSRLLVPGRAPLFPCTGAVSMWQGHVRRPSLIGSHTSGGPGSFPSGVVVSVVRAKGPSVPGLWRLAGAGTCWRWRSVAPAFYKHFHNLRDLCFGAGVAAAALRRPGSAVQILHIGQNKTKKMKRKTCERLKQFE